MKPSQLNIAQLEVIATALDRLLPEVTFVGGSTTALLVDEAAHFGVRRTNDVDVIVDVATLVSYNRFEGELRKLGFKDVQDGPICRWSIESDLGKVLLDVMPTDEQLLGFSNRWYKDAVSYSTSVQLPSGTHISVVSAPYFLATKFEAFAGRGKGDYFSHDLEDIIFVMENRGSLLRELIDSPRELRRYLADQAKRVNNYDFLNVLPGLLNDPSAARLIENNLKTIASWS